jgi:hypothetical protein
MHAWQRLMVGSICVGILAACGGDSDKTLVGGGNRDGSSGTGTLQPFANLAQQCAPDNPYTAEAGSPTTPPIRSSLRALATLFQSLPV